MKIFFAILFASLSAALAGQPDTLLNASYDVSREFYSAFNEAYAAQRAKNGQSPVKVEQSQRFQQAGPCGH
jgi:sulfate/thiosulfate transport system substrate-binding protein